MSCGNCFVWCKVYIIHYENHYAAKIMFLLTLIVIIIDWLQRLQKSGNLKLVKGGGIKKEGSKKKNIQPSSLTQFEVIVSHVCKNESCFLKSLDWRFIFYCQLLFFLVLHKINICCDKDKGGHVSHSWLSTHCAVLTTDIICGILNAPFSCFIFIIERFFPFANFFIHTMIVAL